jgi:hypothetical protein
MKTRNHLQNYPTAELAWLKITALQRKLGLPETPEANMESFMDRYLASIDQLEDQLYSGSNAAAVTPAGPLTPTKPPIQVDPPIPKVAAPELFGVSRSAAAQREGRTAAPQATGDGMPATGWGRAARAILKRSK